MSEKLNPKKVGIRVVCTLCGRMKQPVGRSAPMETSYCRQGDCQGYYQDPLPGSLWPAETEEEFGYPVCNCCGVEVRDA